MNSKKANKKILKPIPKFKSLEEEANFWDTHSLVDYFDFSKGKWGKLNFADKVDHISLGKTKKDESITVRFQRDLMKRLKEYAGSVGLSTSSLLRMWTIEKLASL